MSVFTDSVPFNGALGDQIVFIEALGGQIVLLEALGGQIVLLEALGGQIVFLEALGGQIVFLEALEWHYFMMMEKGLIMSRQAIWWSIGRLFVSVFYRSYLCQLHFLLSSI